MGHNYKKLIVWQKGMNLVVLTYEILKQFPGEEIYGLSSQMKRASVSIVSNIAEGSRRGTKKDRNHFFTLALGSVSELETQYEVARKLGFLSEQQYEKANSLVDEVSKILFTLSQKGLSNSQGI